MLLTHQSAFDAVLHHLAKQRKRAIYNDDCVYRAPDGTKCAVGCLFTDEEYNKIPELHRYLYHIALNTSSFKNLSISFLCDLQILHDDSENWSLESKNSDHAFSTNGLLKIQEIAESYQLEIPEIFKTTNAAKEVHNG